jgi:cytochrome P450
MNQRNMNIKNFSDEGVTAKRIRVNPFDLSRNSAKFSEDLAREAGGVAIFSILKRKWALVSNPAIAAQIQYDNEEYFGRSIGQRYILRSLLGESILTLDGDPWRDLRGSINNSFAISNISKYHTSISNLIDEAIGLNRIPEAGRERLNVNMYLLENLFLQISATSLIGKNLTCYEREKIHHEFQDIEKLTSVFLRHPWLLMLPQWLPHPPNLMMWRKSHSINQRISALIKSESGDSAGLHSLLTDINQEIRRENRCPFSSKQQIYIIKSLIYASMKTSAVTLIWLLTHLANNIDYWHQLSTEVQKKFGTRRPNFNELDDLPILNSILNETLRLSPTVPLLARQVTNKCRIAGTLLNKNDTVIISVLGIHHDHHSWPQPEVFYPERFQEDFQSNTFLPFQLGPHTCPGQHLARRTLLTVMIRLAQFYDLRAIADLSFETENYTFLLLPKRKIDFHFAKV